MNFFRKSASKSSSEDLDRVRSSTDYNAGDGDLTNSPSMSISGGQFGPTASEASPQARDQSGRSKTMANRHALMRAAAAAAIGESLYTTPLVIVDSSNAAGIEIQPSESVEGRGGSTPTPVSEGRPHLMTSMRRSSTPPPNITILGSSERSSEDNQITTPVPRQPNERSTSFRTMSNDERPMSANIPRVADTEASASSDDQTDGSIHSFSQQSSESAVDDRDSLADHRVSSTSNSRPRRKSVSKKSKYHKLQSLAKEQIKKVRPTSYTSNSNNGATTGPVNTLSVPEQASLENLGKAGSMISLNSYYSDDSALHDFSFGDKSGSFMGYAVASARRNLDFHKLFPNVPEADYLIEDYGCALQKEILLQGRMYISESQVCFYSNIFGWVTNITIPFSDITSIEKRYTAYMIPNAIQIATKTNKYVFASFLSRDTTYDVILHIFRYQGGLSNRSSLDETQSATESTFEEPQLQKQSSRPLALQKRKSHKKTMSHKPTTCPVEHHFDNVMLDVTLPTTPEKVYNLYFTSGFLKEFYTDDQHLFEIDIGEWGPEGDSKTLTRNISYIRPLTGSFGPKQTKCLIKQETTHVDFDDYLSILVTTRTPDVPSGSAFSVKTRYSFAWAGPASCRFMSSSKVEWTGRSFVKSIIDKSCLEGQKEYFCALNQYIRKYISEHETEFIVEGQDASDLAEVAQTETIKVSRSENPSSKNDTPQSNDGSPSTAKPARSPSGHRAIDLGYVTSHLSKGFDGLMAVRWPSLSTCSVALVLLLVLTNGYTLLALKSAKARSSPPDPVVPGAAAPTMPDSYDTRLRALESLMQQVQAGIDEG